MNSVEPLQGAPSLGLDQAAGSGLIEKHPGLSAAPMETHRTIATDAICLLGLRTLALASAPTRTDASPRRHHLGRKSPPRTPSRCRRPARDLSIGANKLDDALDWCAELGIAAVTLWVFSTENLKRSPAEVSEILTAIETKIAALAHDPFMHQKRIRVRAIGRLDSLPDSLVAAIRAAEAATAKYNSTTLTIATAYGGREEIVDAVRGFLETQAKQGASLSDVIDKMTSDDIGRHLYAADLPDPDLIIRTSGEIRLSGFLLWQSVHSEFYFTDVLWPAFRKIDFLRAIRSYQGRNRRFGR